MRLLTLILQASSKGASAYPTKIESTLDFGFLPICTGFFGVTVI